MIKYDFPAAFEMLKAAFGFFIKIKVNRLNKYK